MNQDTEDLKSTDEAGQLERRVMLPKSAGHWELRYGKHISFWDVYMRDDWPMKGQVSPFATNENQTDPCAWLGNDNAIWRKVSDHYQGRLAGRN